ncbi:FAD-dependent oxidoreductase [Bacteroides timonensis]|uniref:FAD-dependent oxidoreductase n=1 Tax=Bacteroides timonensis TaxID=1470345 RepID=UPI0004B03DDF|nr:FAD-dependent oxidoreductase [Bacteroides timonensis]
MRLKLIIMLLFATLSATCQNSYDLVIVGGNPGGIMAAVQAARLGKTSVILERTEHIGGLPANGLGATDINTRGATTGLFLEFVNRVKEHYTKTFGPISRQVIDCSDGYHFEPSVAAKIFNEMIREQDSKITVLKMRQFDSDPAHIKIVDNKIKRITIQNRLTGETEEYFGKIFIDATYEGDLGAAANIPFRIGREGYNEFQEIGAGKIYKYWDGPTGSGSSFQGDNAVQSYNYRLCLTNNPQNGVPFHKPENYNREEYLSLVEDVLLGKHTGIEMLSVTKKMQEENKQRILKGDSTNIPGDIWGIKKLTNMVTLPNSKTDANNQHLAFISTDLPEENWGWATSSWEWRDKFAERLKNYTLGLLWFAQNDKALPLSFRKAVVRWQFAKDEYTDNANFPRQVYVREGRRFECSYFFTAKDALPMEDKRPPIFPNSITASHYALDSHAVRKRENGKIHLDGFLSYPSVPYTVPWGVILPKEVDNLLLPVAVSGSHIGFSTLRMEPCWMALGQAAGVASSIAIESNCKMKNISIELLQDILLDNNATLIYFDDLTPQNPHFQMVQYLGIRGYLPEWSACLNEKISQQTLEFWTRKSGIQLKAEIGKTLRIEVLKDIYDMLKGNTNPPKYYSKTH